MKSVVMGGGYGTRLWPLTKNRAKCLLPLGDKPVIEYVLNDLEDLSDDLMVSTNQRFSTDFKKFLEKSFPDTELIVENTTEEEEKPGSIAALKQLVDKKSIEGPLLVVAGDNFIPFPLRDFKKYFAETDGSCLAACKVPLNEAKNYGVLKMEDSKVVDFVEKPDKPESNLASIALYGLSKKGVSLLTQYIEGGNNPDALGYFFEWLINREKVSAFTFKGDWFDIGTLNTYLAANKTVLNGENVVKNGSVVKNCVLKNVLVKENCQLKNSDLDNCIVFEGSKITDSTLKRVAVNSSSLLNETKIGEIVG